jgi:uncharacterized protein YlxW (UPF0749 family)
MTLLNEVLNRPLDAGYAELAARKTEGLAGPARPRIKAFAASAAIVLGLAAGTAVVALRAPDPDASRAAKTLIADAEERQRQVAELTQENRDLAQAVERIEAELLAQIDPVAAREAEAVGLASGATAVSGPGLTVTMDQDPAAHSGEERIRASDLQVVVNGLWEAGAEAIAINGVRLTATSPISTAGEAIHIDLVPIAPPYRVAAIGDGQVLEIKLARTGAAARISLLRDKYGARIDTAVHAQMEVPAAGGRGTLYFARPPGAKAKGEAP